MAANGLRSLYVGLIGQPITEDRGERIKDILSRTIGHAEALKLSLSTVAIRRVLASSTKKMKIEDLHQAIGDIESRIHDELATKLLVDVPDPQFYDTPDWVGIDVLLQFPSLQWEATEAATC